MKPGRFGWRPGTFSVPGLCFCAAILALIAGPSTALAQTPLDTKQRFVAGLIELLRSVPGTYGDEGPRLTAGVDAMEAGLARWDAAIRATENATRLQLGDARPSIAAALRMPLAAMYLERARFEDAIREFTAVAELDPQRADAHMFRGLAFGAAGRSSDAASAFRLAWERDRSNPVAAYLALRYGADADAAALTALASAPRGEVRQAPFLQVGLLDDQPSGEPVFAPAPYAGAFAALEQRRYEDAIGRVRTAVAADPLTQDAALKLPEVKSGIDALRQGRTSIAIERLIEGVARAANSSEAHRVLGTALWFDEQFGRSAEELEAAIRLNPRDERSRLALAATLAGDDRLLEAERVLTDAIDAIPASAQARWNLGRLYQRMHRDADALRVFSELKNPPLAGAGRLYAIVGSLQLAAADLSRASATFALRLAADPNDPSAHRDMAAAWQKHGRDEEARAEFLAALLIDPRDADALAGIGEIHLAAGRFAEAVDTLAQAVAIDARHKTARYALAAALLRLDREEEGRRELAVFQQLQTDAIEADHRTYELSQLKLEAALRDNEGKPGDAASFWQQIVKFEPTAANFTSLGRTLAAAGRHEMAIAAFEQAVRLEDHARVHRDLADAYEKAGRPADSARERARYVELKEEALRRLGSDR